jgi:hypothetical protein
MPEMSSVVVSGIGLGLAVLVGILGLSFLLLPRGGENEVMRAIGAGILFLCVMGIFGLILMRCHSFAGTHQTSQPVSGARR